jgi:hypothetical protein
MQVAAVSCAQGVTVPEQLVGFDHRQPDSALQLVGSVFWLHCLMAPEHVLQLQP